jgi:hypothetical protein
MLKVLMDVYLKFDDSAFGKYRKESRQEDEADGVDNQIKRFKLLAEAMSPLLDPVSKALEKVKEKTK